MDIDHKYVVFTVLDGGIESAVSSLNAAYGDQVEFKCTPVRPYEDFARSGLGIDKTVAQSSTHKLGSNGRIFFSHFVLKYNYRGISYY